jgi:sugar phosphate isomerase/epimerase
MMKLSVTTYPWGKLKTPSQLSKVLAEIQKIGFEGVGLEYGLLPPALKDGPGKVPSIVNSAHLENGGTYSPGAIARVKWAKASQTPLIWFSLKAPERKVAIEKVRRFAKNATENGVTASLHNELGSSFQTPAEIKQAMSQIEELTMCLDTAHGVAAGVDIEKTIDEYHDRITLVHLKDLRAKIPMKQVVFERDFVNVGRGIIDLGSVVNKLKDVGYSGQLMLEIEALQGEDPGPVVREGYEYVKKLLNSS